MDEKESTPIEATEELVQATENLTLGEDKSTSEQASVVNAKPQQGGGGRKGKKKQKWKKVDLASFDAETERRAEAPQQPVPGSGAWHRNQQNRNTPRQQQNSSQSRHQPSGFSYQYQAQPSTFDQRKEEMLRQAAGGQLSKDDTVALSKALVRLLRHGNPRNIPIDDEGYARIDQILAHPVFQKFNTTLRGIQSLVDTNDKKRFEIISNSEGKPYKIKATQGHSLQIRNFDLDLITDPNKHPTVVHGTYKANWRKIKKEGLNRFQRAHIHFAIGLIGETHVTSGMRKTCDVIIYLDMKKAMDDGLKFYESSNNVVLTEGDKNGILSPKYFAKVTQYDYKTDVFKPINFETAE